MLVIRLWVHWPLIVGVMTTELYMTPASSTLTLLVNDDDTHLVRRYDLEAHNKRNLRIFHRKRPQDAKPVVHLAVTQRYADQFD